jgi:L,D-peptidoglycan transpeptidase YkuD (ErfK/YbiS/YcfS/YnhG family)
MSSRQDAEYAERYEADKQWYFNFRNILPTPMQIYTIGKIEKRYPYHKFEGKTIKDASAFIGQYGNPIYNKKSEHRHYKRKSRRRRDYNCQRHWLSMDMNIPNQI